MSLPTLVSHVYLKDQKEFRLSCFGLMGTVAFIVLFKHQN
jgi:hypothetical protein